MSDIKYHEWINEHRNKIMPTNTTILSQIDICNDPQIYLRSMIYMNLQLESLNCSLFQFFPLRTSIIPKYIPIDTKSIVELLVNKNVKKYLDNITKYQYEIWNKYFKLQHPIFKLKMVVL